jgi:uncharacterized membrane protein YqhA
MNIKAIAANASTNIKKNAINIIIKISSIKFFIVFYLIKNNQKK